MSKSNIPFAVSEEDYLAAIDDNTGWCTTCQEFCGEFAEPDARNYHCDSCDNKTVFGAEQALLEGLITIE